MRTRTHSNLTKNLICRSTQHKQNQYSHKIQLTNNMTIKKSNKDKQPIPTGASSLISPTHTQSKSHQNDPQPRTSKEGNTNATLSDLTAEENTASNESNENVTGDTSNDESNNNRASATDNDNALNNPRLLNFSNFQEKLVTNVVDMLDSAGGFNVTNYRQVSLP